MKRIHIAVAAGLLAVAVLAGGVLAAGGGSGDPVISLSYLNGTFLSQLLSQTQTKVNAGLNETYQNALDRLDQNAAGAPVPAERRAKAGDQFTLSIGSVLVPLAGQLQLASGAAVDATSGTELTAPADLTSQHQYIVSERGNAVFTIVSDTAVLSAEGGVTLTASASPDYNAMADALKSLGLFQGSGLSIGSGYELEKTPTRIQGLIMFLRLIGEEQAALSSTVSHPFKDVPAWCDRYVAYAYDKGYTNGVNLPAGLFGPDDTMTASQYVTLLLRALGYSDSAAVPDFNWATSVAFGQNAGLFTEGEYDRLMNGVFYRAQVAYVSYYALNFPLKGQTATLLDRLVSSGVTTQAAAQQALTAVSTTRL